MMGQLKTSVLALALFTILTGLAYPLGVTVIAQLCMRHRAVGSILTQQGKAVGSELIGQPFDDPRYFWGRLSATAPSYNGAASSGSNYGPFNPALRMSAQERIRALRTADPKNSDPIPIDLVTSSASGLDPHISPAAAYYQVQRVARLRNKPETVVRNLVSRFAEGRCLGILGEPRVNVRELNLALDGLQ
jgi:K+-transporting ATPase ATPase C chain